jgi:ectoine hydroxylase-related dioxygenase (phytanoyl-CoA dioxygenase family)
MSKGRYANEVEVFTNAGFTVFDRIVSPALLGEMERHIAWLQANHSGAFANSELLQLSRIIDDPFWHRLVSDPVLLEIAELFLGPDIAMLGSGYFCKKPEEGSPVLWHQDGAYWPLNPMAAITVWIAMDPSTAENGCLKVIPGSHKEAFRPIHARPDTKSILGSGMDEGDIDQAAAIDIELSPGDVSVHHPSLFHASGPNRSPHRCCGLAIRYISPAARILVPTPYPGSFMLRGENCGPNKYHERPVYVKGRHMPFAGSEAYAAP